MGNEGRLVSTVELTPLSTNWLIKGRLLNLTRPKQYFKKPGHNNCVANFELIDSYCLVV